VAALEFRLQLVELVLEFLDRPVDGDEAVGTTDLAPHVVTVPLERDLAHLLVGDARVALFGEVDVAPLHSVEEATEAPDLLDGGGAQGVRDLRVPAADGDLQVAPPSRVA
jgi:hypothetical protein